jgi:hypothetical protein
MIDLDDLEQRSHTAYGWAVTDAEKMQVLKLVRLAFRARLIVDENKHMLWHHDYEGVVGK